MPIRCAKTADSEAIRDMLDQLGYTLTTKHIQEKLELLLNSASDAVYVYEEDGLVVGFITLHFSIQLAFNHNFCEIGYFVVDGNIRSQGVGRQLEEKACQVAKEKGCDRINVFSMAHRADAHRFYERQGYTHIQRFFEKELSNQ